LDRAPEERASFLDEACANDPSLRQEVDALLGSVEQANAFLESPGIDALAGELESKPGGFANRTFGPYRTTTLLGAGGMGEVYLAEDTRLQRKVALKLLAPRLLRDPQSRARFVREARSVSRLNHPHICVLYDIGQQDGIDYLVMEYLEGETLAARLQRGPLPSDQALRYALEIASALDKAHRHAVTHRDLKPGNIMLTKSGAKLLDFGLAKLGRPATKVGDGTSADPSSVSARGSIVGTLQYMSPEQLETKEADARTDIFAFGAVLYEMWTGRKAFEGPSQSSVIAAIMRVDPPPVSSLQAMTPRAIDRIVRICLTKDPDERWQTAHDVKLQLQAIAEEGPQPAAAGPRGSRREKGKWLGKALWTVASVLVLALAVSLAFLYRKPEPLQQTQFLIDVPPRPNVASDPFGISVSPDGGKVAYVGANSSGPILFVRPIDSVIAQPVAGTEGVLQHFWSPDSRYIGFSANRKLWKVEASGGSPQLVCSLLIPRFYGASWGSNGVILFGGPADYGRINVIYRVPATGGTPMGISSPDESRQETGHIWPHFLPDGRHFLYLAWSKAPQNRAIVVGSLDSSEKTFIMQSDSKAFYTAPGYLIFQRDGALLAQPFDPKQLRRTGEPIRVADEIAIAKLNRGGEPGHGAFDVSSGLENNVLVYRKLTQKLQLRWIDRSGKPTEIAVPAGGYLGPDLSPDGKYLAIHNHEGLGGDVWVIERSTGKMSRLTLDTFQENSSPIWSPDGSHIAFGSHRNGKWGIYQKAWDGSGVEEALVEDEKLALMPTSWSKDYILYSANPNIDALEDRAWALSLKDRKAAPLFPDSKFRQFLPQMSPDQKLFAYISTEDGTYQVYVESFPPGNGKVRVSKNFGFYSRWASGNELFFLDSPNGGNMMSSEIRVSGSKLTASLPIQLFPTSFSNVMDTHKNSFHGFAVSRDNQYFLIPENPMIKAPPITVVQNWTAGLGK
jgi:eukaryotic-like serine/threonine-protein kinase